MCFGYYTQVISPPEDLGDSERPKKWLVRKANKHLLLFPELPAFLQRLAPHMLGYVPYITVWAMLMHSFFFNVGDAEQGPPDFVYIIVVGQLVVFTGFGITQLVNQIAEGGPSWYWFGEWTYLLLSLFSKGLLGLTLVANVFLFDSFEEAIADAQGMPSASAPAVAFNATG